MEWKQTIFNQLRERNRQERDVYAEVVKHYNHLIENYSIILLRCTDQERDISLLRQENNDLKIKIISVDNLSVDDKIMALQREYMKAKDEILKLYREKDDMTKELINLSRLVKERDEKFSSEETKNQNITKENNSLKHRLDVAEEKLNNLQKINETIHDEFQALQLFSTQLERHNQDLETKNTALRKDLTIKIDGMCKKFDEEVLNHEAQKDEDVKRKLNDATKDITLTSLPNPR